MEKEKINKIIKKFKNKKILVIGDSIIDISVYSKPLGLSLETPTIKAQEEKTVVSFGGAANVVKNLLELGAKVSFITLLGDYNMKHKNLDLIPIKEIAKKVTIKKRFWVNDYKILQLDQLDNKNLKAQEKVCKILKERMPQFDVILLVDYRHGIFSKDLINKIKRITKKKRTIASSQTSERKGNHLDYEGVDLICMNLKESEDGGWEWFNQDICVTLGKDGAKLVLNHKTTKSKGIKVKGVNSCGAGDCFLAALSLCDYKKYPKESLYLSNVWAGLSVKLKGTETPKKQEFINYIKNDIWNN